MVYPVTDRLAATEMNVRMVCVSPSKESKRRLLFAGMKLNKVQDKPDFKDYFPNCETKALHYGFKKAQAGALATRQEMYKRFVGQMTLLNPDNWVDENS